MSDKNLPAPAGKQVSKLERIETASNLVRNMIKGKATVSAVVNALKPLGMSELSIVATATRMSETKLQELQSMGQADLPL